MFVSKMTPNNAVTPQSSVMLVVQADDMFGVFLETNIKISRYQNNLETNIRIPLDLGYPLIRKWAKKVRNGGLQNARSQLKREVKE